MTLFEKVWNFRVQTCLRCGSLWGEDSHLCAFCLRTLLLNYSPSFLGHRKTPVSIRYIFDWQPGESESLSVLLHFLKGSGHPKAWRFYADLFWQRYRAHQNLESLKNAILIPSPPALPLQADHAGLFCQNLAEISGLPTHPLLLRENSVGEQKAKSKGSRKNIKLKLSENFSPQMLRNHRLIFIDDIVTTGATAIAAMKALKAPGRFEVWALASRGVGCDKSLFLL